MYKKPTDRAVTIPSGQQMSDAIDIGDYLLGVIHMPAAFTGSTITVYASPTRDGTYNPLYANGAPVVLDVAVDQAVAFVSEDAGAFATCQFLKFESDQAEAADRELVLGLKG